MSGSKTPGAFRTDLRERRKAAGFTQKELAAQVGVTRQALIQVEAGEYLPNTTVSLRLARVLGCRVEDLFRLEDTLPETVDLGGASPSTGGRVLLGRVGQRMVGYPANPGRPLAGGYGPADALLRPGAARRSPSFELIFPAWTEAAGPTRCRLRPRRRWRPCERAGPTSRGLTW